MGAIPTSSLYLHSFPFQYMEFRKTMDIDHILEWQPPEVRQQRPPHPKFLIDIPPNSLGITGDHE